MGIVNDYDEIFDADELLALLMDSPATGTSPTIEGEDTSLQSKDSLALGMKSNSWKGECQGTQSHGGGTTTESFNNRPFTNFDHRINIESDGIPYLLDKRFINGEHTPLGTNPSLEGEGFNNHPFTNFDPRINIGSDDIPDLLDKRFVNGEHTRPGSNPSLEGGSQSRSSTATGGFNNHPFTNFDPQINIGSDGIPDLLDKRFINGEHTRPGSNPSLEGGSQSRGGTTTEGFNNHPFTNSDSHMIESGGVFSGEHTHPGCDLSLKGAAGTSTSLGGRDTSLQLRDSRDLLFPLPSEA